MPKPIHPFPARMAPEVALEALGELSDSSLVLDPMAGSGTVLRAAADSGHKAIGIDSDPLAVLMSTVWTTPIHVPTLQEAVEETVEKARSAEMSEIVLPWIDEDQETRDYISFWFAQEQRDDLRRLSYSLPGGDDAIASALRLGISRTIVTKKSGASLAWDVSHSRPHKVSEDNSYDVLSGFERAMRRIGRLLEEHPPPGNVEIYKGDARHLHQVKDDTVDAVITSPPYLNAIDYIRGHRLALVWMGHQVCDLRAIRANNIGAERAAESEESTVSDLFRELPSLSRLPSRIQHMVLRYRHDLAAIAKETARVLVTGGRAVFVVGNSTLYGVFLDNAKLLTAAAVEAGLTLQSVVTRALPQHNRYLPPPTDNAGSLSKRMREEVVLSFALEPQGSSAVT